MCYLWSSRSYLAERIEGAKRHRMAITISTVSPHATLDAMTHDHQMKHTQSSYLIRCPWCLVAPTGSGTLMEANGGRPSSTVLCVPLFPCRLTETARALHSNGVPLRRTSPRRRRPSPPRFMRETNPVRRPTQGHGASTHRTSAPDEGSSHTATAVHLDARPPSTLWGSGTRPTASSQLHASPTGPGSASHD